MKTNQYYTKILEKLAAAFSEQDELLELCAEKVADCVAKDGIVHTFGTGHSHMLAEELFYRAGGLGPVNAILNPALMLHEAAELSTFLERSEGLAEMVLRREEINEEDVVFIFSNSGRNAVPVEAAQYAKEKGAFVIGLGSGAYKDVPSRHSTGKKMNDLVDVFLDNKSDVGDACVSIGNTGITVGATSTVVGAALINDIVIRAANLLNEQNAELPFFISANGVHSSDEHNQALMDRYRSRVRSF